MTFTRFIQRPVLSTVISVFLVLLGLIGIVSLPIAQYPDITPPTISVVAYYQGADAQTVLNSVVVPLEESINGVENMTYMESTATNDGTAMITIYFKQGVNADMAAVNRLGFVEVEMSILTHATPEGAKDYHKQQLISKANFNLVINFQIR